jgi:hypothetical protein
MPPLRETDLYPPVKDFLERQGYDVKSEVSNCDVVAVRGEEEPVVVELKTAFTLPLVFQALKRQSMTDLVYVAFAIQRSAPKTSVWSRHYRDILKLCRMLGLGLITLRMNGTDPQDLEVHLDPAPYRPRKNQRRRGVLLREFDRRIGDPNQGGMSKRPPQPRRHEQTARRHRLSPGCLEMCLVSANPRPKQGPPLKDGTGSPPRSANTAARRLRLVPPSGARHLCADTCR